MKQAQANTIRKSPSAPLLYLLALPGAGGGGGVHVPSICSFNNLPETMRRFVSFMLLLIFLSVFVFAPFSLYSARDPIYGYRISDIGFLAAARPNLRSHAVQEEPGHRTRRVSSISKSGSGSLSPASTSAAAVSSLAVLFPDWEVLLIVSPVNPPTSLSAEDFSCIYPNNETSPARFSGILPSTNQSTFKCELPRRNRHRLPFLAPELKRSVEKENPAPPPPGKELLRWNFLVYESFSTETDVVLFVKGVNNRQGVNRPPQDFRCVFSFDDNSNKSTAAVRTAITSSVQEVFRCRHPDLTALISDADRGSPKKPAIRVSLEVLGDGGATAVEVPSAAHYTPWRAIASPRPRSLLCACTMVLNAAKFLREWVTYHSAIGVQRFILYDNGSDDDLRRVVKELNGEGYSVEVLLWVWPKTQESGFSHAVLHAGTSCEWMMYADVDEFVFAPSWENSSRPSDRMLASLIPDDRSIGQVSIRCNEFGPSDKRSHPPGGVTQGYTCRRRLENRHKSLVRLAAVDYSLLNAVHHFLLDGKYRGKQLSLESAVVNHYKYQAWSEFKAKFRRRVSAYVVDWRQALNPLSNDRTPGLGFEPVEPPGWERKFCEVWDERLKLLTRRWFGTRTESGGYRMAWQR